MKIKIESGKPIEFSKKILIVAAIVNIAVIVFSCYMMFKTENLEPLTVLIPSVAGAAAVGEGFYYNKAKLENKIKLMKKNNVEFTEESFKEEEV